MNCEKLIYAELNEAELLLKGHKAERESRGEITRGELRGIIIELEEPKHSPQQEDDGTPCGEAAARQVEGQWLVRQAFRSGGPALQGALERGLRDRRSDIEDGPAESLEKRSPSSGGQATLRHRPLAAPDSAVYPES